MRFPDPITQTRSSAAFDFESKHSSVMSDVKTDHARIVGDAAKSCFACENGADSGLAVLSLEQLQQEVETLPMWKISEDGAFIERRFVAKNFSAAMSFLNEVARIAEEQGHHPDLHLTQYRHVEIRLQTHSMKGVTRLDISEAKRYDSCPVEYSPKWLRDNPHIAEAS